MSPSSVYSWQEVGARVRKELKEKIPYDWNISKVAVAEGTKNILPLFQTSGILTPRELEITDVKDATSLLEHIHGGNWSATEVTLAFSKRAALAHELVNCLMDIDIQGALRQAAELDRTYANTGAIVGPLHGLPISIKDLTKAKGLRHSFGFTAWADNIDQDDAVVVRALREAGAIIYVKTTMPQTGMALETVSNLWGRTLNPHNLTLSAGGSSGGEGAVNACHGAPIGIATDIGGSIRAPASFNGLYGLRPSSRRFSYVGNVVSAGGQIAIVATVGPVGRSVRDLALICKVMSCAEMWNIDSSVPPLLWSPGPIIFKPTIGVMMWDKVVMPHPPILREMKSAAEKLRAAGFEVIEFEPYRHEYGWDITLPIYFPTAGSEVKEILGKAGEPMIPSATKLLEGRQALTVPELMHYQREQKAFQLEYGERWNATKCQTSSGQPIDALLTPSMGSCSFPHDFLPWWGYLSTWNLLDYPSIIIPVGQVEQSDCKDVDYEPVNARDKENHSMYDPAVFEGAPVSLQLVGRTFQEEKLLAVAMAVDKVIGRAHL